MNDLQKKIAARTEAQKQLDNCLAPATRAGRALSGPEQARFERLLAVVEAADDAVLAARTAQTRPAVVRFEPKTYNEHNDNVSYLKDVAATSLRQLGWDADAAEQRLARHAREIEVDARRDPELAARIDAA
jgi:hypothetical protein